MNIPLLTLLGFALWTLLVLAGPIGVHRWGLILTRRATIDSFPADATKGPDWYRRAMRAHANCVENLPVFGAIVTVATFIGLRDALFDVLSVTVLGARVCQSSVHMAFVMTARGVSVRFTFFAVQLVAMFWMAVLVLRAMT